MAATVGDLLEAAQRHAWDLARDQPLGRAYPNVRAVQVWPRLRAHLAGWPALAQAAEHALSAMPAPNAGAPIPIAGQLRALQAWTRPGDPDPAIARITHLLGAAGDLLAGERVATRVATLTDASRAQSRILAAVETTARSTRNLLDHVRSAGNYFERVCLDDLAAASRRATSVLPGERSGRLDGVAADRTGEIGSLIHSWETGALAGLDASRHGAGAQRAAVGAAFLLGATRHVLAAHQPGQEGHATAMAALQDAHLAWAHAARAFVPEVRPLGRIPLEQAQSSNALSAALRHLVRDGASWRPLHQVEDPASLAAQLRQGLGSIARVGEEYRVAVHRAVEAEQLAVAARRLDTRHHRARGEDVLELMLKGRWVRLPVASVQAQAILATATTAHTSTQRARQHVDRLGRTATPLGVGPVLAAAFGTAPTEATRSSPTAQDHPAKPRHTAGSPAPDRGPGRD